MVAGGAGLDRLLAHVATPGTAVIAPRSVVPGAFVPGATMVAADVESRTPGCSCCAVRLDLIAAVERAVLRRERPGHVVVAVDLDEPAAADVVTVVYTLLSDPDLARLVRLDGVVVAVDPVALATRRAVGLPVLRRAEIEALAVADRVLVGRADALTPHVAHDVDALLHAVAPYAYVLAPARVPVGRADLFGIDAWHGVPHHHQPSTVRSSLGLELPDTVVLRHQGALDPDAADLFFDRLVTGNAPRILRFQGVVVGRGSVGRTCCHGVRSYAMSHPAAEDGDPGPDNLVVVTGWGLDTDELADDFREATA